MNTVSDLNVSEKKKACKEKEVTWWIWWGLNGQVKTCNSICLLGMVFLVWDLKDFEPSQGVSVKAAAQKL